MSLTLCPAAPPGWVSISTFTGDVNSDADYIHYIFKPFGLNFPFWNAAHNIFISVCRPGFIFSLTGAAVSVFRV